MSSCGAMSISECLAAICTVHVPTAAMLKMFSENRMVAYAPEFVYGAPCRMKVDTGEPLGDRIQPDRMELATCQAQL